MNVTGIKESKRYFPIFIGLLVVGVALFSLLHYLRYRNLAFEETHIPVLSRSDSLIIPQRPGVGGIVISGPFIKDLIFQINPGAAGVRALDWGVLLGMGVTAKVTIYARINDKGALIYDRREDFGSPEAGLYIAEALKTWMYFPFKTGPIRFHFHAAAVGNQLTIDANALEISANVPPGDPVVDGLLYYITGIDPARVGYGAIKPE